MKFFKQAIKYGSGAALAAYGLAAQATPNAAITAAVEQNGTTVAGYATLMVLAGLAVWAVRAAGRKMGWWL